MVDEALGTEENKGMMSEIMDELSETTEEMTEQMTEKKLWRIWKNFQTRFCRSSLLQIV